jgi:halocin C8-like bacteriocin domain-containing protein
MSEKDSDSTDSREYNRRDVLKTTSTASLATALGTAGLSGQVSATDQKALTEIDLNEVTGPDARQAIDNLRKTSEWTTLVKGVDEEGWNLDVDDAIVYRSTARGNRRVLASIGIKTQKSDEDYFRLIIGRDEQTGDVISPSLERRTQTTDGAKLEVFRPESTSISAETSPTSQSGPGNLQVSELTIASTESGLEILQNGETVSPTGIWCTACKTVASLACQVGCASGAGFICGLASVATSLIGGGACLSMASAVCAVISANGCGLSSDEICCEAGNWCCGSTW